MMAFTSCRDLDIPPKNIITGTDVYNEAGMEAYMAALYGRLQWKISMPAAMEIPNRATSGGTVQ